MIGNESGVEPMETSLGSTAGFSLLSHLLWLFWSTRMPQ